MLVVEVTGTLGRIVKSFTAYMSYMEASRNTVYSEGDHLSAPLSHQKSSTFLPLLPGHK